MGYPMTWKRVVSRAGIEGQDYGAKPSTWNVKGMLERGEHPYAQEILLAWEEVAGKWSMIVGDLKRLKDDGVDEKYVCTLIQDRTGVAGDDVAAVLKEFFSL